MVLATMMRIPVMSLAIAVCALLLTAGAAVAATPKLVPNPTRGPGGTTVALLGTAFDSSRGVVEIDFGSTPVKRGLVVAGDGSFQTTIMVPGGAQAGTNAINAFQQGVLVAQTAFDVTPSTAAPTGNPPTSPAPSPKPTPVRSPGGTPIATPTTGSSPVASGATDSPSPRAAASGSAFPPGLLVALVVALVVIAAAIGFAWLSRRRGT